LFTNIGLKKVIGDILGAVKAPELDGKFNNLVFGEGIESTLLSDVIKNQSMAQLADALNFFSNAFNKALGSMISADNVEFPCTGGVELKLASVIHRPPHHVGFNWGIQSTATAVAEGKDNVTLFFDEKLNNDAHKQVYSSFSIEVGSAILVYIGTFTATGTYSYNSYGNDGEFLRRCTHTMIENVNLIAEIIDMDLLKFTTSVKIENLESGQMCPGWSAGFTVDENWVELNGLQFSVTDGCGTDPVVPQSCYNSIRTYNGQLSGINAEGVYTKITGTFTHTESGGVENRSSSASGTFVLELEEPLNP
jgi:hypothetical protein